MNVISISRVKGGPTSVCPHSQSLRSPGGGIFFPHVPLDRIFVSGHGGEVRLTVPSKSEVTLARNFQGLGEVTNV